MEAYSAISVEQLTRLCCIPGEAAAWAEFVRRFHRLIAKVVSRVAARWGDSSKETVDDLIQETYLKFCADNCRLLREFDHRHPDAFIGFIQIVGANVARDHFKTVSARKRSAMGTGAIVDEVAPPAIDGAPGTSKAIERTVLIQELQRQLNLCIKGPDQERNSRIFWLYYRAGLSAASIASLSEIDLTTKGVESLIYRLSRELRERIMTQRQSQGNPLEEGGEGIVTQESL